MVSHLLKFMDVTVGIDGAETRTDGVIDKKKVGEFVPRAIVVYQIVLIRKSIRTDFHHGTIFRTATWSTIDPNNGSLFIGNVLVFEMPEEQISMRFRGNFNMAAMQTDASAGQNSGRKRTDLPSMHIDLGPISGQAGKVANIVIGGSSFC